MDAALYWTIWIALALFAAGELGKRGVPHAGASAQWSWPASAAGLALLIVHNVIAMGARHGWSHDAAWSATADQTAARFGLAWGGGLYFNYAFGALWLIELWRSRPARSVGPGWPPALTAAVRCFYLVMIINAAIVFAGGLRRWFGVLIVAALVVSWWPHAADSRRASR